jgi:hypothetical protein
MIKTYVLIMLITNGSSGGKATITQEFSSLKQCEYVQSIIKTQLKGRYYDIVVAGGCFEK